MLAAVQQPGQVVQGRVEVPLGICLGLKILSFVSSVMLILINREHVTMSIL